MLSSDKFDPCLEGGLLLGRLPVRDAGLELDLEPPGVMLDLYEGRLGVRKVPPSLSDRDSGVPADSEDFECLEAPAELIGCDRTDLSRT